MKLEQKVNQLKRLIDDSLSSLITSDYRLLEIPDYPNPGDALIFRGELNFLENVPCRCVERSTMTSFLRRMPDIPEDELLIFRGGGYFGDLWRMGPDFQKEVLKNYPNNPILIFPQSVFFGDKSELEHAVKRYGSHKNLVICMRDKKSYDFIRYNFNNDCRLVPDMAFYSEIEQCREGSKDGLLILRDDKELRDCPELRSIRSMDVFVSDWPSMNECSQVQKEAFERVKKCRVSNNFAYDYDKFIEEKYFPFQIESAIRFVAPYKNVYSTRLHGGILSLLMGKKTFFIDNSYGKISSLYHTWLYDCEDVVCYS